MAVISAISAEAYPDLDELWDDVGTVYREEIRDLIATYAHRAAHRQSMADLFTDDIAEPPGEVPRARGCTRHRGAGRCAEPPGVRVRRQPTLENLNVLAADRFNGFLVRRLRMPAENGQHEEEADDVGQRHVPAVAQPLANRFQKMVTKVTTSVIWQML